MRAGDKVLYIYNKGWDGKNNLTGATGIIYNFNASSIINDDKNNFICRGYVGCHWTTRSFDIFDWYVPIIYIRKLKSSELP
jgi:hypothetical protein